jgi:hypothetical protein
VVPPDSHGISRAPCYLGVATRSRRLTSTGVPPSTPGHSMSFDFDDDFLLLAGPAEPACNDPTTPHLQPLPGITQIRFSLFRFRSPLLTESLLFSLPVGTEMFHFPTFPPTTLCVQVAVTAHDCRRVSPFGHPRILARLPTPRGFSQAPTSFFGSWCQGIHRAPLLT